MISELIDTFSNLEYGILIAILITILLMLGIKVLNDRKQFTPMSFIISLVLCLLLTYQMSRMIGACRISNSVSQVKGFVELFSPSLDCYLVSYTDSDVNYFILRRVLWSLLFSIIAGSGIWITMKTKYKGTFEGYVDYDSTTSSNTNEWGI